MMRIGIGIAAGLAGACLLVVPLACEYVNTSPNVLIVAPHRGDLLNQGNITVKVVVFSSFYAVRKVLFYIDSVYQGGDSSGEADTFRYDWDAAHETLGFSHKIKAVAFDAMGNSGSDTITVAIGSGGGPWVHNHDILANDTWSPVNNPHLVRYRIEVRSPATLTILPGCRVQFNSGGELGCGGDTGPSGIIAVGKPDSLIRFTSNMASPSRGDWNSIDLYGQTSALTQFSYCTFEYGGGAAGYAEICIEENGVAKIDNCTIRNSSADGIRCDSNGAFGSLTNNTFTANERYPLVVSPRHVPAIGPGNSFSGNGIDGIELSNGTATCAVPESAIWPNPGVPYVLSEDVDVGGPESPVLTIAPGVTLKMGTEGRLTAGSSGPGAIDASGQPGSQIIFTSAHALPGPGDWGGIRFLDRSLSDRCKLINCKVEWGGGGGVKGSVYVRNALPAVSGDSIGHAQTCGIFLDGAVHPDSVQLETDNTFYDCRQGDVGHP